MTRLHKPSLLVQMLTLVGMGTIDPYETPALRRLTLIEPWDLEEPKRKPRGMRYGQRERAQKLQKKHFSPLVASYHHAVIQ